MKWDTYFTPYTKIKSKCIKDLNVRRGTIKILKEKIGGELPDIGLGYNFLDLTPEAQVTKGKTDKWDYIKQKSFYTGGRVQWLMPAILALWEAEAGRSPVVKSLRPAWPT